MNGTNAAATLTLEIDTRTAGKTLDEVEAQLGRLDKQPHNINLKVDGSGLSNVGKGADEASAKLKTLEAHVTALEAKLKETTTGGGAFAASYSQSFSGIGYKIKQAAADTSEGVAKIKGQLEGLATTTKGLANQQIAWSFKLDRNFAGQITAEARKAFESSVQYDKAWVEAHAANLAKITSMESAAASARKALREGENSSNQVAYLTRLAAIERERTRELEKQAALNAKSVAYLSSTPKQQASQDLRASVALSRGYDTSRLAPEAVVSAQSLGSIQAAKVALEALSTAHTNVANASVGSTNGMKHWKDSAFEAHSAARGLSGALGGLWITYGSLVPMVAMATLGAATKEMLSIGSKVEFQSAFLTGLTGQGVALHDLEQAIAGSMQGVTQASDGLRALAQSGMSTRDALAALPEVLNMATVGETDVATAAFAATGVLKAFSLEVSEMGRVSDVMVKAAAISNAGVSDMMQAFKYGSASASRFGTGLEEVAAHLTILSEKNIKGSMAGVAFTNMMKDLYAPSKKGAEALKAVGVDMEGMRKAGLNSIQILEEIKKKTANLDSISIARFAEDVAGERGIREFAPLLNGAIGELQDAYSTLKNESKGFTSQVMLELSNTVEGSMARLKQAVHMTMSVGMEEAQGPMQAFINSLTVLVSGDGLKSAFAGLATGLTNMTRSLQENGQAFAAILGVGYVLPKVLSAVTSGVAALGERYVALTAVKTADTVATSANTIAIDVNTAASAANRVGAAGAAVSVGRFASGLALATSGLGLLVGLGAAAWAAYELFFKGADKAADANDNFRVKLDAVARSMDQEISRLGKANDLMRERNRLRADGKDPDQANSEQLTAKGVTQEARQRLSDLTTAKTSRSWNYTTGWTTTGAKLADGTSLSGPEYARKLDEAKKAVDETTTRLNKVEQEAKTNNTLNMQDKQRLTLKAIATRQQNILNDGGTISEDTKRDLRSLLEGFEKDPNLAQSSETLDAVKSVADRLLDKDREKYAPQGDKPQKTPGTPTSDEQSKSRSIFNKEIASESRQAQINLGRDLLDVEQKLAEQSISAFDAARAKEALTKNSLEVEQQYLWTMLQRAEGTKDESLITSASNALSEKTLQIEKELSQAKLNKTKDTVAESNAISDLSKGSARYAEDLRFEQETLGKTALEVSNLRIERERLRAIEDLRTNVKREGKSAAFQQASENAINDRSNADKSLADEQSTFSYGWSKAFSDYARDASDAAKIGAEVFQSSMQAMEDAIVNFETTGKMSFQRFGESMLKMLLKITAQKLATGIMGGLMGAFGSTGSSSTRFASSTPGYAAGDLGGGLKLAKGGVFNAPSLHSYVNQVHDTPQLFQYAKGAVFAEAGPEAVMPLARGSDGKLGVKSQGGGGNVSVEINNYSGQKVEQKEVQDGRGNRTLQIQIGEAVAAEMLRSGSAANKAMRQPRMVSR